MVISDQLVGRTDELDSIQRVVGELDRGRSTALAFVGEPGIGKTRLLGELAGLADGRGQLVLTGSASELERDLPFWVFVDALDEYVQGLDPQQLASLDADVRAELAQVLPALPALAGGPDAALQHERYRTHRAVRTLLERLAATRPLVLILDDLHWADAGSVELLGALLHRPPTTRVLLVLAMRPRQVPERLSVALERAHRAGTLTRIELGALTPQEAEELLGVAGDGATATALYHECGGNPFYLEQLARSMRRERGAISGGGEQALAGIDVPASVAAALAEELGLLTEDARLVLEGAAVAGDPFEPELAAAAAGTSEAAAMVALDELLRLDLVRPTDVPRRFRFRHPLVRRAVYEATPGGWRLGAHERSAEALAARGAPAAARAHHVELSARHGDPAAVATLREAGEAAARSAPASAARWFESALRLLSDNAPAEVRIELLLARASSLAGAGHVAESHAALLESIRILPPDAVALRVRLIAACAGVEHLLGRYTQALERLEAGLAELEHPDSPEAVSLMIELAVDGLYRTDFDAMTDWADRAVDASAELGDRALTAAALAVRATGAALGGTAATAQAYREEAARMIDALSDDELARRLDALVHLSTAEMYLDHFEPSSRHAQQALTIGRATGQGDQFPLIFPNLGTSLWVQGRVAESAEVLDGAVEAARVVGNVQGLAWNLFNRSFAAFAAGDLELARATAEESVELAKSLDPGPVTAWAAVALANALLESGDATRAADLLVSSVGGEELRMIGGGWRAWCLELLTRCRLAAGSHEDAERSAEAAQECADAVELPLGAGMAGLAKAALDLDSRDYASGAERALAAATILDETGAAFDAAMARMTAGRALAQAGEQDQAAAELERAGAAFDSFGASRHRAEAEQELRKLGRHIHRRTRPGAADGGGVAALTERELELARLVVERKTNPEIAAELFLSQKTVETHLRNMFRKVGVASRVELARAVERSDRTENALSS
jgi:ATP/maltotriose-dependent transcriptional regulator MalT